MRKPLGLIIKILPFVIMGILIAAIFLSGEEPGVDMVLSLLPDNMFLSAVFLLTMYALKSLSVIFPIILLQIAAGLIFPIWYALLINIIGTTIAYAIPYFIGRISGSTATEKLLKKHPKAREIVDMQRDNSWFPSFILRAVSCLPADIVSMCLGSINVPFIPYIVASVIGTLPGLIPATTAGMSMLNPKSGVFIISVAFTIVTSVASIVAYAIIKRKNYNTKSKIYSKER